MLRTWDDLKLLSII